MTDRLPVTGISRSQAGMPITRLRLYGARVPVPAQRRGSRADEALAKIYQEQSSPLTGLAALLIWAAARPPAVPLIAPASPSTEVFSAFPAPAAGPEAGNIPGVARIGAIPAAIGEIAEEIVHDALAAMHREWHRLRDAERAVAYLRRAIVHEARAHGRAPRASQDAGAAVGDDGGLSAMSAVVLAALRRLPGRQREALVLRYYADLPEAAAADAMGVTRAAFRGHAARGMIALRLVLDQGP
ncbi:MAG TPA: sigma factor-like helix-turn-helix DNA-binding protein [Trebonia sp.]|jgi:DNA-directed RNA polymerase specialized sigma24 family protein|nr:sigma factor-like helix-turn-helix DNA-binding protein [Trebonia sp.]